MISEQDSPVDAELDDIDRRILRELEWNARISNSELAARAGISESTCHRRVRAMIASGAIAGFRTVIAPAASGLVLEALIAIRLHSSARGNLRQFQEYLQQLPAARHVYFVAGDQDFLLHVAVRDPVALRELVSDTLSLREEVAATNTSVIFDHAAGGRRSR